MAEQQISIALMLESAQALTKLSAFVESAKGVLNTLSTFAAGAGLAALAKSQLDYELALRRSSEMTGFSIEQMAGLAYAAKQEDLSLDQVNTGLKKFSEWLVKTGQGSTDMMRALVEQSRQFSQMADGAGKAALAVQRFGKAGTELIPLLNLGPERLQELVDRGERLSGITEQSADSSKRFSDELKDLQTQAMSFAGALEKTLFPAIERIFKLINDPQLWEDIR